MRKGRFDQGSESRFLNKTKSSKCNETKNGGTNRWKRAEGLDMELLNTTFAILEAKWVGCWDSYSTRLSYAPEGFLSALFSSHLRLDQTRESNMICSLKPVCLLFWSVLSLPLFLIFLFLSSKAWAFRLKRPRQVPASAASWLCVRVCIRAKDLTV